MNNTDERWVNGEEVAALLVVGLDPSARDRRQASIDRGADLKMRSEHGFPIMDFALGATEFGYVDPKNLTADAIAPNVLLRFLWAAGARPSEPFKPVLELAFTHQ